MAKNKNKGGAPLNYIFWVRDIEGGWKDMATFSSKEKADKFMASYLEENEPIVESCGVDEFETLPHDMTYESFCG